MPPPVRAEDDRPWCLALAGPTAAGKTAAALALAREWPLEIVSVDSALVYRGMDIGTAKPSALERAQVPHHLIDIVDPAQSYSAARFAQDADTLVRAINGRGRMALLAGGTMLYFKALIDGLHDMPPADTGVRAELEQAAHARGWPALHGELARVDPVTAARLAPNDSQRIQRALEVYRLTGRALSSLHGGGGAPAVASRFAGMPMVSLEPRDRAWLHERIEQRFDAMLAQGLLDEVRALRARGDLHPDLPSMRCVGYRQAWEALEHGGSLEQLRERGVVATRQLAKRQLTWLRSMPARHIVACDDADALAQVLRLGRQLAGTGP
ncbi:tRNA (adenosine(37)-N6)-dimethylallyltransferase MiaA [Comamonadaceae bacterium G21597-S1]|nr:tRNA (adenosine(37)-N6)-dimethylallyltransferase MiaA [Comamonadaceae bacterium G21597-S1]